MNYKEEAVKLHRKLVGKISINSKKSVSTREDLSLLYTPGVAEPCRLIANNKEEVWNLTSRGNLVAVVSDGSAVLGLGNIGPEAGLPVMEGKAVLFKEFANIDAFPICLSSQESEDIISFCKMLEPTVGGINLEDISAPRCFYVEEELKKQLSIPVFHDDQHGTAIVCLAGMINAFKITSRKKEDSTIVINGGGSAGTAIANILLNWGIGDIIVCDKKGILCKNDKTLSPAMATLASRTNKNLKTGDLKYALEGADALIGVSAPGLLKAEDVAKMNKNGIIFAMANPEPEIYPEEAYKGGAAIVATGRSDYPNQVNNVLAFPGIFRGALAVRASEINEEMKMAAALAIANMVSEKERTENIIIPSPLNKEVAIEVAINTAKKAIETKIAKNPIELSELEKLIRSQMQIIR